jgi:L-fuconolactonase
MSTPVVDAHQHVWDLAAGGYAWLGVQPATLRRTIGFDELRPHLERNGVHGTVLVQADDTDADTDAMFDVAAEHPEVWGVVGYVPLERPAVAAERLAVLQARDRFVGVRNLIHDQPDPDWLLRPDVADGLRLLEQAGIPFDLVAVLPRHLEHVDYLTEHFAELPIVIDHLAKPPIKSPSAGPWEALIRRAAASPQVYGKVSGLYPATGDWADHTGDDLRRWVDVALEAFGPDRLMIGSDWPVSVLAGGYDVVWSELVDVLSGYGRDVSERVLGGTALAFYGLQRP